MCDSPHDVYAKCLPNNRGYPLWFPEPSNTLPSSYRQDGLQIGDVGYVDWDGAFNVLFNISYGPHHALHNNRRLGVAFNFNPIQLDIDYEVDINSNADPPGRIITSPGITQPTQTPKGAVHYEFTPSSSKGAILILPDGATSHKLQLQANERFRKVAIEHAFDWYELAKEHYGGIIRNDSLYLITGFYKAKSWSLASFHDSTGIEDRHIWVVPREGGSTRRDWKHTFPLECRDGPESSQYGNANQTIFIRGFKIAVRDDVLGWLSQRPEVHPVPLVRPHKSLCGLARFLRLVFRKPGSELYQRKGVGVSHAPAFSQPFHPSDMINRYLLEKDPDALVAVTHDNEWIDLIETGKLTSDELTKGDCLERFLSENYRLISQSENSAVYLQSKSNTQEALFKSNGFWNAKSFIDHFQVVITRIRAEDVVASLGRLPVGFYVLVEFNGTKKRTGSKPIRLHDNVVEWDERIQLPFEHSAKVRLSVCASFEFSPMLGNGEVLRTMEISIGDSIDSTRLVTFPPTGGGNILSCSSLLLTMERSCSYNSGATLDHNDLDWEESSELVRLTDQGHDALLRYRNDANKENVTLSIGYFEHALSICPNGHQCHAAALCNLSMAHFVDCRIDYGPVKLSTSISYYQEVLDLRRAGHPDRPATLLRLAEVLLYRYGKLGGEDVPSEITELASEVQACCSVDSHERRAADLVMQTLALYMAVCSGSLVQVDRMIPVLRQAIQDIPPDYFDRHQRLSNLGLALRIRYEFCGDVRDVEESVALNEEAMRLTPFGLDSPTHTQFLKEWAKERLAGGSWKDALATAASFMVPRFTIYRIICEYLETIGHITDAGECFCQMVDELIDQGDVHNEQLQWVLGKLESVADTAMSAGRHNDAVFQYSVALSLNPDTPQGLFLKRSKAYLALDLWKDALNDADKVIVLDPSSPSGYEMKHAALHQAGNYEDAISAFEQMLSVMSSDPEIREHPLRYVQPEETKVVIRRAVRNAICDLPRVLINTISGRLLDKSEQAAVFESLPVFHQLISSMTKSLDHIRIERDVTKYYRYAMFSHKWGKDEPSFQAVIRSVVYDLDESPSHEKLKMFCKVVRDAGFHWAWSDTCCIDQADHVALQEALVLMFKWYQGSALTLVLLCGVRSPSKRGDLVKSIWNTRAWTFQEYHASKIVRFYNEDWTVYRNLDVPNHKESPDVVAEMEEATGISARTLMELRPNVDDIREKLFLVSTRQTTRIEDAAYSLLGIFTLALAITYGEGGGTALGRLLAQLLTVSGDTSILAWTGRSGEFNSCLPAQIVVFNQLPSSHIPLPITSHEMDAITTELRTSSLNLTSVAKLYERLNELPIPVFVGHRMTLPCIVFNLGPLSGFQSGSEQVFRGHSPALGVVEIKTKEDLSRSGPLYLAHPWIDFLLDRQPVGNIGVTMMGEHTGDQSLANAELSLHASSPSGSTWAVPQTLPQTRKARLVSRLRRAFGGRPRDTVSFWSPSTLTVSQTDKQMRALRVIARLKRPFGALLFTSMNGAHRRVAPESLITVQVGKIIPGMLNELIAGVRILEVF